MLDALKVRRGRGLIQYAKKMIIQRVNMIVESTLKCRQIGPSSRLGGCDWHIASVRTIYHWNLCFIGFLTI